MHNAVVIKGNKSGMSVFLDPDLPFEELLKAVAEKFFESSKFWGSVQMTLTLEGRTLTPDEEFRVVNTITENSQIEILCLVDHDANRISRCEKALNEKLMELSSTTGQFYRGDLKRGDCLEAETSIVIIGDVGHGAKVLAKGNIVVLGELRGTACAGIAGNESSVVFAMEMIPMQVKIADFSTNLELKGKRLGKGPVVLSVENKELRVKHLKKSFLNTLNFI